MLFAIFGLGWAEIVVLGLCCGGLGVVIAGGIVAMLMFGKRSGDPDDSKNRREEKARREAEDKMASDLDAQDAGKTPSKDADKKSDKFTAGDEKSPGQDAGDAAEAGDGEK